MPTYFAAEALLPEGWAKNVRMAVNELGEFGAVRAGAEPQGSERLAGPALPGMANVHSHAFQRAMAGLAELRGDQEDDFWTWRELMYRFVARLTPGHAFVIAQQTYIELLKHGYTAVAEFHYVHNDEDGKPFRNPAQMLLRHHAAAHETGIAITLLPSMYRWSDFESKPLAPRQKRFASDPAAILKMVEAARRAAGQHPDERVGVAPHSLRAVDTGSLDELIAGYSAIDPQGPIHIHAAEQLKEVDACVAWRGKRPVEWLLAHMPVNERWCLVHATHMTEEESKALARSGAVAGLCPSTEANLGDGVFALLPYREAGGRYGIGGDSHVSRSAAEELRLLETVQRLQSRRRNLVIGKHSRAVGTTLWLEAAAGGAQALGRPMGAIATGLRADLVVLDGSHPDVVERSGDAITNAFVFSSGSNPVRDVMVGGKWSVRQGRHAREEVATQDYRQAVAALLADA
ncbi:MAG: formimidoylglutamate deiminase [Burkholderiales bacterium]